MQIFKEFVFDAAHMLTFMPEGHPCARLHGHSFRVEVVIDGQPDENGLVMDLGDVEGELKRVRAELDHSYLNEIAGLEQPTLERLTEWIWQRLEGSLSGLSEITIRRDDKQTITEYRINGRVQSIKVEPFVGPTYWLVDTTGDGFTDTRYSNYNPPFAIPGWVILRW